MNYWRNFKGDKWQNEIDLADFIQNNYTPYDGDGSFLKGTTPRTDLVKEEVDRLLVLENEKGEKITPHPLQTLISISIDRRNN